MLCWRGTRPRWPSTRFRGRTELPGHQLGKLRSFVPGLDADLGERPECGLIRLRCLHCDSPLFPARSGAVVGRRTMPGATQRLPRSRAGFVRQGERSRPGCGTDQATTMPGGTSKAVGWAVRSAAPHGVNFRHEHLRRIPSTLLRRIITERDFNGAYVGARASVDTRALPDPGRCLSAHIPAITCAGRPANHLPRPPGSPGGRGRFNRK